MKDFTDLLMYVIAQETKFIEIMRYRLKEDEFTILRLKNKMRAIEKEIDERKKSIDKYRGYLRQISDPARVRMELVASTTWQIDTNLSNTNIQLERCIEKQA